MNKKVILGILIVIAAAAGGFGLLTRDSGDSVDETAEASTSNQQSEDSNNNNEESPADTTTEQVDLFEGLSYTGTLADVTSGDTIRGISTATNPATGKASYDFVDNEFRLHVEMAGLPEPQGTDFYEGWLVRKEPFEFISTGEATLSTGGSSVWINSYNSETDYSDFTQYVLTLEPDDGDPAPADHILEGDLAQ